MIISFIVMYGMMFTNCSSDWSYYAWQYQNLFGSSDDCAYGSTKIFLMSDMYRNKRINSLIVILAIATIVAAFTMLRKQTFIKDVQYMKAMIPHHSSAIMVSRNATFEDPETKQLANDIIEAQQRETDQMKDIIQRLESGKQFEYLVLRNKYDQGHP